MPRRAWRWTRWTLRALTAFSGLVALAATLALTVAQHTATAFPGSALLPNLVADPPTGIGFVTDSSTGTPQLLLRFNGFIRNTGPGAVDFRGSREKPNVSKATEEEVEYAREHELGLPEKTEEELAVPPMGAFQRLFTTKPGEEETNIERAHVDEPNAGELKYVSADGHFHWHLQRVARYSLWNASRSAEVAPAQKVGFCMDDSQHVEPEKGPSTPVYSDHVPPYREFCDRYRPNATSLYEGISPGWRDIYNRELAFQWVDVSGVLPGEYWLREDVNPLGFVIESPEPNVPSYTASPVIVPGFNALAQSAVVNSGESLALSLSARAWNDPATPRYAVATPPQHGTLDVLSGNRVNYTPDPGYIGPDSFTFSASDPTSPFPTSPALAAVAISVTPAPVLLTGDATSSYTVADVTTAGAEEVFHFSAAATGLVQEMRLRTNGVGNGGISGVNLGIFAEGGGRPGEVLGQATAYGEPPTNSWIRATGVAIPVVRGAPYWLALLPLGSGKLHYNVAVAKGGSGDLESKTAELTALAPVPEYWVFNQGPLGLQALGTPASVAIEGAPATMTAGTSVQLGAHVANDASPVLWSASAGSITSSGLFTAPAKPPAGGHVVVSASLADAPEATSHMTIAIVPPARAKAAPELPGSGALGSRRHLSRPRAMLIGRRLIMTTTPGTAGRVRLSAFQRGRRLGSCASRTPARRTFTCRLTLGRGVHLSAPMTIVATLRAGRHVYQRRLGPARIPEMRMHPVGKSGVRAAQVAGGLWCSPSTLVGVLVGAR